MASANLIILVGNIGRVEVKTFQDGGKIVEASLATKERYQDRNGQQHEDTQWHRLVIGGKLADVAERFVGKGDPLYIEGRMKYRKYTSRDGAEKEVAEVQVKTMQLLRPRQDGQQAQAQAPAAPQQGMTINPSLAELMDQGASGDLPF